MTTAQQYDRARVNRNTARYRLKRATTPEARTREERIIRKWENVMVRLKPPRPATEVTSKVCRKCGRQKPLKQFQKHGYTCKVCLRIWQAEYRRTPEYREWYAEYRSRPERKAKKAATEAARYERKRGTREARKQTPMFRARVARISARCRLKRATTPEARERLQRLIDSWSAEISILEAKYTGVDGRKVRHMPTGFNAKGARP